MTAYTSSVRVGPPTAGRFVVGDTFTDSLSAQYECKKGGQPGLWGFVGPSTIALTTTVNVGAAAGTGVVATEFGNAVLHQTKLTLTAFAQVITSALSYAGSSIYTFPEGRILVLGTTASLTPTTTTAIASTLEASAVGALSLGTVTASNTTLSSTMVNLLPSTAWASSTVINVAAAKVTGALAASAQFDGTTTPVAMFFNTAVPVSAGFDIEADATVAWTGTITFTWAFLGDY